MEKKLVIAVAGRKTAGKDLFHEILQGILKEKNILVPGVAFADSLKQEMFEFVSLLSNTSIDVLKESADTKKETWRRLWNMYGDHCREKDQEYFSKKLIEKLEALFNNTTLNLVPVIKDWRYPDELIQIREKYDVVTVYIENPKAEAIPQTHSSERMITKQNCDYIIYNGGESKDQFTRNIREWSDTIYWSRYANHLKLEDKDYKTFYYARPFTGRSLEDIIRSDNSFKDELNSSGILGLIMKDPFDGRDLTNVPKDLEWEEANNLYPKEMRLPREIDYHLIDNSDFLIVDLRNESQFSYGCFAEICYAVGKGKPCFIMTNKEVHPAVPRNKVWIEQNLSGLMYFIEELC